MKTFTFRLHDSKKPSFEPMSLELHSKEAARREAISSLMGLASDALPDGNTHDFSVVVADEAGEPLFEAALSLRARWLTPEHE